MSRKIEIAKEIGFCSGVRRAITALEKAAQEKGNIQTLGALVHNEPVLARLSSAGIHIIYNMDEINTKVVAISAHGIGPQVETRLRESGVEVIDTTCPDVKLAQKAAQKLFEEGYFVLVYGDVKHPEVEGILGYTGGKGLATLNAEAVARLERMPQRLGIISQTTQIPDNFVKFIKAVIDLALQSHTEIRIIDTICRGVGKRQMEITQLARRVDLMLVVGSGTSANTKRLYDISSKLVETYLITTERDIDPAWLIGKKTIGIASGTSTSIETVNDIVNYLENLD
jgi:4-hydroxy-3-methylbut-2-enyl diphosphate reductase